jgi:hypothetical protein
VPTEAHILLDKRPTKAHIVSMQRQLALKELASWRDRVGGLREAIRLIGEKLECSKSKAEKLAAGRYPSLPTPTEQMALAELMNKTRDELFPFCASKKRRAS